jgi:hypothetical protein
MSGPITNFELGKMQHREYEAWASKYWGQGIAKDDKPILSKGYKLAWSLIGAGLSIYLIVQILAF